jgi:hypothetical protein
VLCKINKQNEKRKRIQDVVEVVSSNNTFASIQQVSEDNLKELLCQSLISVFKNEKIEMRVCQMKVKVKIELKQTNKQTNTPNENCNLIWIECQHEVHIEKQFHKQHPFI